MVRIHHLPPAFARCEARAKAAAPKRKRVGGLVQNRDSRLRLGKPAFRSEARAKADARHFCDACQSASIRPETSPVAAGISPAGCFVPRGASGNMAQTHYIFPASNSPAFSIQVNLRGAEAGCKPDFEAARSRSSIGPGIFPYGLSEPQWWDYCLAPHSYLLLGAGQCQVGLNLFNRFLHLDLNERSAQLVDPGVGNEMLSTTNWFNQQTGELWFASWPVEDTVRRILQPRDKVRVTIWRRSVQDHRLHQVWRGDFADSLHQLSLSPDHRFLILTEMGLRPEAPLPAGFPPPGASGTEAEAQKRNCSIGSSGPRPENRQLVAPGDADRLPCGIRPGRSRESAISRGLHYWLGWSQSRHIWFRHDKKFSAEKTGSGVVGAI